MPENDRLNDCLSEIELGFLERESTPQKFMKLGIQLHLTGLSLSDTVSVLELFSVDRARSTVHNWVHKADLQPEEGQNPDHVAVDETVIQLNDERYWLYAAVDTETNDLVYTKLEPVRTNVFAHAFFTELREKHDVDDAVFSSMVPHRSKTRAPVTASISDTKNTEIETASSVSFER